MLTCARVRRVLHGVPVRRWLHCLASRANACRLQLKETKLLQKQIKAMRLENKIQCVVLRRSPLAVAAMRWRRNGFGPLRDSSSVVV